LRSDAFSRLRRNLEEGWVKAATRLEAKGGPTPVATNNKVEEATYEMVAMLMETEEEELLAYTHDYEIATPVEIHKQWLGYDESHDSWEPWAELRSNRIVHAYCRAHDIKGIVPKNAEE